MARIFSYVITHDYGFAPNPFGGFCTLATCKPKIRLKAAIGDWLLGTGSTRGVGVGRVIYAARIDEVRTLEEYGSDSRFELKQPVVSRQQWQRHGDNIYFKDHVGEWQQRRNRHHNSKHVSRDLSGKNVLIARTFWYFGPEAIPLPNSLLNVVKSGPGHKCIKSAETISALEEWLKRFPQGNMVILG